MMFGVPMGISTQDVEIDAVLLKYYASERLTHCLQVDEQQLKKQLEEINVIIKVREKLSVKFPVSHNVTQLNQALLFILDLNKF